MLANSADKQIGQKLDFLLVSVAIIFALIILRLFYLQIYAHSDLANLSQRNSSRLQQIYSLRGNILDHNGKLLATNRPVKNLCWLGTGKKKLTHEQELQIAQLTKITGLAFDLELIKKTEHYHREIKLIEDLPFAQLGKLEEYFAGDPNIYIETTFTRFYPYDNLAAHVVGYLGAINFEKLGRMGLEKMFERDLQGQHGKRLALVNAVGRQVSQVELLQAIRGKTLETTIDLHLQKLAEETFPAEYRGAMLIMDPSDGALKTIFSRPTFSPEIFLKPLSPQTWQELQITKPFINRAFSATYPPASIFKLVSMAAALETHLIQPDGQLYCSGYTTFANRKYHCHENEHGHGLLTTREAIAQSCNIPFYQIARQISIDKLAEYAHKFGLGEPTGIIFPEQVGLIPTRTWKKTVKNEPWWPGETLSAVIGQSYLLATPIQIIRLVAAVFQGYLVKPRFLKSEAIEKTPLDIKPETLKFLKEGMILAAQEGTARRLNNITDLVITAKTGTAQTKSIMDRARHIQGSARHHVWFVCHVQYAATAPLIIVIIIENTREGTQLATATAHKFLIKYRDMCRDRKQGKNFEAYLKPTNLQYPTNTINSKLASKNI
ncbi:MAG TPA: penicillin-binding protein 2 [Candidatus Babeliales bacterium]|nr:penicillin-binding protein 2 [Candidatus Babeliales bacterium]